MYNDEVNVINIQAAQLVNITDSINTGCSAMTSYADPDHTDKDALKAYIASVDVLMTSLGSQCTLLQQALDKLAEELKK